MTFFGSLAEISGKYLKKGRSVYIEGKIKTRKWQDKTTGQDRYATEIVADQMQMLGGRDDIGNVPAMPSTQQQRPQAQQPSGGGMDMDDDVPF